MFFLFLKNIIIYCLGPENYRIMLICELTLSLDSEWNNKIILPTPDNSVCFSLFWYMATSMNLRYAAKSILTMSSKGNLFKSVFSRFFKISDAKHVFKMFLFYSHIDVFTIMDRFMPFPPWATVPICIQIGLRVFEIIYRRTDERTGGQTDGSRTLCVLSVETGGARKMI